jgi:hypothetical protein
MANRIRRKWLEARAELIGLQIGYYNPGDGIGRYSVGPHGDYHMDEYFYGSAKEVSTFITGWLKCLDKSKKISKENNNG